MTHTRREFLMGCSAAIAAMAAGKVTQMAFANPSVTTGTDEIFVLVFLRGGCDSLSLLSPYDDPIYRTARAELALPTTGEKAALRIEPNNSTYNTSSFGLNASMPHLKELYDGKRLAFVHACGLEDDTRSHFDAMDYIERGTPGEKNTGSGWIARHLQSMATTPGLLPVISSDSATPSSLLSYSGAVAMPNPRNFGLSTHWRYNRDQEGNQMLKTLNAFYPGSGVNMLDKAGKRTLETIDAIKAAKVGAYTPRAGITYPNGSFGEALKTVAQVVKMEQGLRVATVDFGGWDTHESQANSDGGGYLPDRLGTLSQGLYALTNDLVDYLGRLTVVVMSEFGRRLGRNASNGTDHGHGSSMMVLGGNVNGGRIFGKWPGLANLDQGQDLRIETDFRVVLSEVVSKRLGNTNLGAIFPGLTATDYAPLGLVNGAVPGPIKWNSELASPEPSLEQLDAEQKFKVFVPLIAKC